MRNRTRASLFWIFLWSSIVSLVPGCGCPGDYIGDISGVIATDLPNNRLIFTDGVVGTAVTRQFNLYNSGNVSLQIDSLEVEQKGENVFSIVDAPSLPITLEPGISNGVKLKVQFSSNEGGTFTGRLLVQSPNADNVDSRGLFRIELRNQQLFPDPRFSCGKTLNFGAVEKGKSKTLLCKIHNAGTADFVIQGVKYAPEKGSKDDYEWKMEESLPLRIPPGKRPVEVSITYRPSNYPPAEDQGLFVLESNSPVAQNLRVVGTTAVSLVELVPLYPTCKSDGDCKNYDRRLSCTRDDFDGTSRCLPRKDATPFLLFPLTSKGKTTKLKFAIRSTGALPLEVNGVELDSSSSGDFKVLSSSFSFPIKLSPKQQKVVEVEYAPSDNVVDTGSVVVSSNAGNRSKSTLLLEASSRGCNLEVNPRAHTFRAPKPPLTVNLINVGNESCLLKKVYFKDLSEKGSFALLPTPAPNQTIVPGGRIDFLVNFNPQKSYTATGKVIIESSDPDEPTITINLKGGGDISRECDLDVVPRRLVYGLVVVGRSKKLRVGVYNKGWGSCRIGSIKVNGTKPAGHQAFQLSNRIQFPIRIDSGSNIALEVTYSPSSKQSGFEGTLTIDSDDRTNPTLVVPLSGSSGTLCLEVVPSAMDFGSSKFGCSTPTRNVEVYNLGNAGCQKSVEIQKIALAQGTSTEFRIMSAPSTPKVLGPGEGMSVGMSYKPKTVGVDTGTLEIENNIQGQSPVTVPLVGEGVSTNEAKDVFKQLSRPLVDIMFVVDDSGSMGDDQDALAKNFKSFINWAVRLNVDYQIMVTTTDVTGAGGGPGCARGNPKIVTPQTPDPIGTFQRNVRVGTRGSPVEKGLEAAYRALIPPASTGCNRGFYRKAASLSMIFVSDETDQSPQSVQFYVSYFKSLKGFRNVDLIRASVVVGPPPSGCRGSGGGGGFAAGAPRYWQVAKELRGSQQSLCTQNWSATLSNLAAISFGYRGQFYLSRQADPLTIRVKVNGSVIKQNAQEGWTYDSTSNSILFSKKQLPPPGATIQVEYKAVCLP